MDIENLIEIHPDPVKQEVFQKRWLLALKNKPKDNDLRIKEAQKAEAIKAAFNTKFKKETVEVSQ